MAESKTTKSWLTDISEKIQIKKKTTTDTTAEPSSKAEAGNLHKHDDNKPKVSRGKLVGYILVSVVTAIVSIVVLVASVNLVLFITYASFDQTDRQKGCVVLAASAVVTLGLLIGGLVAIRKNKRTSALTIGTLLIVVAAIQALVVGLTVAMKEADKDYISEAMAKSFWNNTYKGTSRVKWNFLQSASDCCGVLGPEDYRDHRDPPVVGKPASLIPPNIPMACCKGFEPDVDEKEQEQNRQRCRFQRTYSRVGCQHSVIYTSSTLSVVVAGVSVVLMVLEILTAIPLFTHASKKKKPAPPEPKQTEGIKLEERKGSVSQNK